MTAIVDTGLLLTPISAVMICSFLFSLVPALFIFFYYFYDHYLDPTANAIMMLFMLPAIGGFFFIVFASYGLCLVLSIYNFIYG